jgi:uncharacterized membrane protein (DUF106 family)
MSNEITFSLQELLTLTPWKKALIALTLLLLLAGLAIHDPQTATMGLEALLREHLRTLVILGVIAVLLLLAVSEFLADYRERRRLKKSFDRLQSAMSRANNSEGLKNGIRRSSV